MIQITCPNCDKKYRVKEKLKGKTLECPNCEARITAEPRQNSEEVSNDDVRAELMRLAGGTDTSTSKQTSGPKKAGGSAQRKRQKKTTKSDSSASETSRAQSDQETDHSGNEVELQAPRRNKTTLIVIILLFLVLGLGGTFGYFKYQSYQKNQKSQRSSDATKIQQLFKAAKQKDKPCQRSLAIKAWTRVRDAARQYERTYGDGRFVDALSQATSRIQQLRSAQKRRLDTIDQMQALLRRSKTDLTQQDYSAAAKKLTRAQDMGQKLTCKDMEVKQLLSTINARLEKPVIKYGSKGWVRYKGEWMPPAKKKKLIQKARVEEMREQGLVKYEGEWMKPEAAEELQKKKQLRRDRALYLEKLREKIRKQIADEAATVLLDPAPSALRWKREKWANPCTLDVTERGTAGKQFVSCRLEKGEKNKWVVSIAQKCSIKAYEKLRIDMICPQQVKLAIGIWSHPGYKLHETRPKQISGNESSQTIEFDLSGKDFKSKKSKWRYTTRIENPENVYKFSLFFYSRTDKPVYFRNLRLTRPENKPDK